MKRFAIVVLLIALAGASFHAGRRWASGGARPRAEDGGRKILYWYDPMHPSYRSDKPGIAPDCGMNLEPFYAGQDAGAPAGPPRRILYYRDPQDARYVSDKPGLNPETDNDLEPVYEAPAPGTVEISAGKQQLIGVRTEVVQTAAFRQMLRSNGRVALDERRIERVQSRVEGWIEKVFVDFTGAPVAKGQPMLTIYSPELVATQQEFVLALEAREILRGSILADARLDNESLVDAARRRLLHWNLTEPQIAEVEETRKPLRSVTLYSPASGIVTARNAFPNQRIGPETELYTLADLSRVWIIADIFEPDAARIRVGQHATIELPFAPGRRLHASVTYILPQVDPATRTLKVRLEAANPAALLKPDMFVDVNFQIALPPRVNVPADAVLDAGASKRVFVDLGNGFFEPRLVETGARSGDRVEIVSGLKAGERIVTSGTFLVDSESQMTAALSGMGPPAAHAAPPPSAAGGNEGHRHD